MTTKFDLEPECNAALFAMLASGSEEERAEAVRKLKLLPQSVRESTFKYLRDETYLQREWPPKVVAAAREYWMNSATACDELPAAPEPAASHRRKKICA